MSVGQRVSFNGARGTRDPSSPSYGVPSMEGNVTRVGASKPGGSEFQSRKGNSEIEAKVGRAATEFQLRTARYLDAR